MLTPRNESVVNQARMAAHPTGEREIAYFARGVRLADVATPCRTTLELYGHKVFELDVCKLAHAWVRRGLGRGFDDAVHLVEQRLQKLQLAA